MEVLGKGTSPCVYTAFGVKQETLVAGLTPILALYQYYDSAFLSAGHYPVIVCSPASGFVKGIGRSVI